MYAVSEIVSFKQVVPYPVCVICWYVLFFFFTVTLEFVEGADPVSSIAVSDLILLVRV